LPAQNEKAMEINRADVAELVDARDLKFVAPFEIHRIFCITRSKTKTEIDARRQDLHNDRIAALAAFGLITAPEFGQASAVIAIRGAPPLRGLAAYSSDCGAYHPHLDPTISGHAEQFAKL
jgi:hypothetical protein